jgi:hypothetical protein
VQRQLQGALMRPAEVGPALIRAAKDLAHERNREAAAATSTRRGATLAELAERACVGQQTARNLVPKLKSRGQLEIVGLRKVDYRNRPVAEYAPPDLDHPSQHGWANLGHCLKNWTR